ncbi:hypothetical protein [Armatimonas rosea]|uniref:Uncharacterized protein n=1 Tax=Armatimonas rosea TaxID=685828 RepID=A0A7W9SY10_ARMRO|nr:hypothetical protein [Armatimonas rosea]MBB6053939.1 hypothetical protein [Armatimonas rosea]
MNPLPLYATPGNPEIALFQLQHRVGLAPQVVLSPNLRLSGLLHIFPADLLQVFIALLTFQEGGGEVRASVAQVADALRLHSDQAAALLQTLAGYTFDGAPMIYETTFVHGEQGYGLSKRVGVPINEVPQSPQSERSYKTASKEQLIALSRERYATPISEAEAIVAEQLGTIPEESPPPGRHGDAYRALLKIGVPEPDARELVGEYELESIEQQLAWLPERGARNPARFIVAAIRGTYDSPEARRRGGA